MPSVECHILCYCEAEILPYTLRHYATFCERIVVHDAFSKDGSRDIAKEYGAEVRDWDCPGVDDLKAKKLKEDAVMTCKADWCAAVDADEFIYFPLGSFHTLESYDADKLAVIKTRGYEMFSDEFPATQGQIYDVVTQGAPDFKWYSKPVLVAPRRVKSIIFGAGCHQAWAKLTDGGAWNDEQVPADPETRLLHFHHIGGLDRIGRRYAGQQSRHSQTNIKNKFGNFEAPMKHAQDKRAAIVANLERVVG